MPPGRRPIDLNHVNHFIDVHDVGEALVRAALSEPVLDVERYEAAYPDALALMRELKTIGAHNVTAGRPRTLRGRARLARMQRAYEGARHEGVLPATFEVIYGAAWGALGVLGGAGGRRLRYTSRRARSDARDRDGPRALRHRDRHRRRQNPDRLRAGAAARRLGLQVAVMKPVASGAVRTRAGPAQRRRAGAGRLRQRARRITGR